MPKLAQPADVLAFWFTETAPKQWYQKDMAFDRLIAERRAKLNEWRESGEAFPNHFRRDSLAADLQKQYGELSKEELDAVIEKHYQQAEEQKKKREEAAKAKADEEVARLQKAREKMFKYEGRQYPKNEEGSVAESGRFKAERSC